MAYPTVTLTPKYLFAVLYPASSVNMEGNGHWSESKEKAPALNHIRLYDDDDLHTVPPSGWSNENNAVLIRYTVHRPLRLLACDRMSEVDYPKRCEIVKESNLDGEFQDNIGYGLICPRNPHLFLSTYTILSEIPSVAKQVMDEHYLRHISYENTNLHLCRGDSDSKLVEEPFSELDCSKSVTYDNWQEYVKALKRAME